MKRIYIKELHTSWKDYADKSVKVCGWIKTIRSSGKVAFIELSDGTVMNTLQVVLSGDSFAAFDEISRQNVGAALTVIGNVVLTPDAKQAFEVHATDITVEGASTPDYPLQKKRHTLEYLRTIAHLRPRTNTFQALFRVRSELAHGIHRFFADRGFVFCHSPIITGSDCEGAGEMFTVTTLDFENYPKLENGKPDFSKDYFAKQTGLTVSGQLQAETFSQAFTNTYTFGPTFRAEKSNTSRHSSEFWMMEPEISFADLGDLMELASDMVKYLFKEVLKNCPQEMQFFNDFYDKGLIERLTKISQNDFAHITYTEAIEILEKVKDRFTYPVFWGCDLQTEHERYLCEEHFAAPCFVTDYPKEIKAFYMRLNDDGKTVAAMDLLVPSVGEIMGGSQREERLDVLIESMKRFDINPDDYSWYLDLRRYGTTKHAGFGLGFERLVMYTTAMANIRDVIPFPRTPESAEF